MEISNDYIRGLTDGEGSFTFCNIPKLIRLDDGTAVKIKLPAFIIRMNVRDKELIRAVRDKLGLKNRVYEYRSTPLHTHKKSYKRGNQAVLIVRDLGSLKNIIIPFFYARLIGHKGQQFIDWLENIGSDPAVSKEYKLLYRLHKSGWFNNNPRYIGQ